MTMRIKASVVCVFFFAAALAFAAGPPWELAPPDAKILAGADVRSLRNSSLTDSMTSENRAQVQAAMSMIHFPGMELLNDVDSVFMASSGQAPTPKAAPLKAGTAPVKSQAPFVLVISGTFPEAHLRPLLKGAHATYKGVSVYHGTGANGVSIAILDEHTILIGDDRSLYRGIDRKTLGVKAGGPLLARAQELAASNDIWMVAHDPSGSLQRASAGAAPGAQLFASEIEGVDFGISAKTGFDLDFSLDTKTEAGAQALTKLLMTQMQSAVNAKMDSKKAVDFWHKVKVDAAGNRMEMQIALTKEELRENILMMQQQKIGGVQTASGAAGHGMAAMNGQAVAAAPAPKPAGPRIVRIYGLDDGVREIKLDPQN